MRYYLTRICLVVFLSLSFTALKAECPDALKGDKSPETSGSAADTVLAAAWDESATPVVELTDEVLAYAKTFLGVPYRRGGAGESGFDCSGFTSTIYSKFGFFLPRTSNGQAAFGLEIGLQEVSEGDLLFFKGRNKRSARVGHVGIVASINDDEIRFIHASVNNGISIDSINSDYYSSRFIVAKRIIF